MAKVIIRLSKLGALHCDACGHTTPRQYAPGDASNIGKPCPKCGASLLTQADHNAMLTVIKIVNALNGLFGPLFGKEESEITGTDTERYCINPRADSFTVRKLGKDDAAAETERADQ